MRGVGKLKLSEVPVSDAERKDPALHMEMQTLRAEREERHNTELSQVERERLIAEYYEVLGRIKGVKMVADFGNVAGFLWIQQVRERKLYKQIPGVVTWEKFCDSIGMSRRKVEEDLENLAIFGEAFIGNVAAFGVGYRDLRKLRLLTQDGTVQVDDNTITIEGESITVDEEHAPEIQAAVSALLEKHTSLSARVEKLEKQKDAIVKEETKTLTSEIKAFKERVKQLEIYEPDQKDRDWCVKQMAEIEKAAGALQIAIARFVLDPRLKEDRHLQARVDQHLREAEMALHDVRGRLDDVIDMFTD